MKKITILIMRMTTSFDSERKTLIVETLSPRALIATPVNKAMNIIWSMFDSVIGLIIFFGIMSCRIARGEATCPFVMFAKSVEFMISGGSWGNSPLKNKSLRRKPTRTPTAVVKR